MTFDLDLSNRRITVAEYLDAEELADIRSEYHDGEVFAMVGAKFAHNAIASSLHFQLSLQLQGRPCRVLGTSMKVHIADDNAFVYPDILIVCGQPIFFDAGQTALMNPSLVMEVLSESTETYDRGHKFDLYKKIAGLDDYLLVHQDEARIDHFRRQPDGDWLLHTTAAPDAEINLRALECRIALADIYDGIELPKKIVKAPKE